MAHEQEQRRISREMHDELGQELTALKILIARIKGAKGDEAKSLITEAGEVSETLLEKVRDICSRLRPLVLDDLGLIAGLSVHLRNFGSRSGLVIEFEHGAIDEKRLTPIAQIVVFRVIQEAVTNVARHAKTDFARVTMAMDAEHLEFAIEDKGQLNGSGMYGDREKFPFPNAVIADLRLGPESAIDFLKWIKGQKFGAMPVLVLSGTPTTEESIAAKELGALEVLRKPASFGDLRNMMLDLAAKLCE